MAEERYYLLTGVDSDTFSSEDVFMEHVHTLLQNLKDAQNFEVKGLQKSVYHYNVGLEDIYQNKLHLVRLHADKWLSDAANQELRKNPLATLISMPEKVLAQCECQLDTLVLECLPNVATYVEDLLKNTGVNIYIDKDNAFWLSGKWFQVAIAKQAIDEEYFSIPDDTDFETSLQIDENHTKFLKHLLAGRSYITKNLQVNIKLSLPVNTAIFCITFLHNAKHLTSKIAVGIALKLQPNDVMADFVVMASYQGAAENYMTDFRSLYNCTEKAFAAFSLPQCLLKDYKNILQDVISSKFKPTFTVIQGKRRNVSFVFPLEVHKSVTKFVSHYREFNTPSKMCGINVLTEFAVPYPKHFAPNPHDRSLKDHIHDQPKQEGSPDGFEMVDVEKENKETMTETEGPCLALFMKEEHHLKCLSMAHKEDLQHVAKQHEAEFCFENDYIEITANTKEDALAVVLGFEKLYQKSEIITRDVASHIVKAPEKAKLLILRRQNESTTSVTGPKDIIDSLEGASKKPEISYTVGTSIHASNPPVVRSNSVEGIKDPVDLPKRSGRRRNRELLESGMPSTSADSTSNVVTSEADLGAPSPFHYKPTPGTSVYQHVESATYIEVGEGDLTKLNVDAVVNAANPGLKHEGGVAKAIAVAAGPAFSDECQRYVQTHRPLNTGDVGVTGGGNLPCKKVMHAIGPIWVNYINKDECRTVLKLTFQNCLNEAHLLRLSSIAIPAISSGIFGVPKEAVAKMGISAVDDFLGNNPQSSVRLIRLIDVKKDMIALFNMEMEALVQRKIVKKLGGTPV